MKTNIAQMLNFSEIDALLEGFNKTTGFVTAILDLKGHVLSKSGWRPICTEFHRTHSNTLANCVISDTVLANKMEEGEKYHFYKCMNGLVDVAMPIILNNEHVANLFSGQFFLEEPDLEYFRMQAKKYGFDEEKYLSFLEKVPIVSEEKVKTAMDFLHQMTQYISERSFEKAELLVAKEKLEESSANITAVIEGTLDSIWAFDRDYNILYINNVFQSDFQASFGVTLEKGSNLLAALPESIRPIYQSNYDRVLNNEHFTIVDKVETEIGSLYIQITFNPILKNNEVIGGSCFGSNITHKKQLELDQSELLRKISTMIGNLEGIVYRCKNDPQWTMEYVSEGCYKLTGYKPADFINNFRLGYNDIIHPDYRTVLWEKWQKVLEEKTHMVFEYPIITRNLEIKWVWEQGCGVYDENANVIALEGFITDITERKNNEDLIKNLSTSFAHLMGKSFFEAICEDAAKILKLDYLFVGKLNGNEHSVTVTGGFAKDLPMGDLTYQLSGTPCEQVIGKQTCSYPSDIQKLFPEDELLQIMGIQGYIGIPLFSKDEKPIGIMVGMHESPITNTEKIQQIFSFYVERASAELQRTIAEEALRESESQFRGLFDFAADAIFIADIESGIIIQANEKAGLLMKCTVDELIGKHQRELHAPEKNTFNEDTFIKQVHEIEEQNFAIPIENTVLCSDGTQIPVEIIASEVKYHGKICLMGIFRDISERKKYEKELIIAKEKAIESEALLNITNEIANVGGWEIKLKSNELIWTKQVYEIHEVDDSFEPTVEKAINFYDEESIPVIQAALNKAITAGKHFDVELKIITAKGNIKDVRAIGYVKFDENNQAEYVYGSFQDIADRKKADNQLRKLSQAVEQSPSIVLLTNINGEIEYVNPKFSEATGYRFEEVIGKNPRILKSGEQPREYYKNLWDTITSGRIWQGEFHNKKKNGDLYWESVQISPIKNEKGETINYLAVKEDITERKAMEIRLNETMEQVQKYAKHLQKVREEEKALLAREIHDELGQLLVALKMDTGVTTTQYNKAESNEDKEKIKLKLSKHADMITKAISSARHIMYGLRPVKLEMLGFAGACEDYIEDFMTRYEIECKVNIDLNIEKLDEDRSLAMYRILQETMMNIVKHAQATTVEITYYQADDQIVFEVKDNGIGFTIGQDGREDSYGLLGINERVTLLKGTLNIESSPGNGTKVSVMFPI